MSTFISTTDGKIINIDTVAFLTTRINPKSIRRGKSKDGSSEISYRVKDVTPIQLVVAFSAAAESKSGMIPLSLVIDGEEALDFLAQMEKSGVNVDVIREKVTTAAPTENEPLSA